MSEPQGRGPRPVAGKALVGTGLELAITLMLFLFAGHKIDGWLDRAPAFLVTGGVVGIAVGFFNLFRRLLPPKRGRDGREG